MGETAGLDVLAFGAHPDDVELGCGGTLLRARDAGLRVGVVDVTAGERGSRGTRETRAREAEKASAILRLAVRETLGFPDTQLSASLELRRAVVSAIRRHRPRVVLAPMPVDLHPDHAACGQAVRDAYYPSGMLNADATGAPWRPRRVFHYPMHDEPATPVIVDVTPVWEERLELVRCFASQLHAGQADSGHETLIARPDFLLRIEARARVWGRRASVNFGEPLLVGAEGAAALDVRALFA
jgi:bacillithiol biosynthesis deacetylase BshB1